MATSNPQTISTHRLRGGAVLRNVLVALTILVVAVFAFVGYNSYSARQHEPSDEVYSAGSPIAAAASSRTAASSAQVPAAATMGNPIASSPATGSEVTSAGARNAQGVAPPAADTIAPDPPNGMTFGGGGHYQLYRQGDLTWRLNTDTGETCVLFATDQEWHKPKVYSAGCRGKS